MTATDLDAIRTAIRQTPADRLNWLAYADALQELDDPRGELVFLMARPFSELSRDERKRLSHLRGTVPLLSESGREYLAAVATTWRIDREPEDVAELESTLRDECHPVLLVWGTEN